MNKLVFLEQDWSALREHLLKDDRLERAAFGFVQKSNKESNHFYVRDILLIEDEAYRVQTPTFNSLTDEALVELVNEFKSNSTLGIIEFHSHPFSNKATFSGIDDENYPNFRDDLLRRKKDSFFLRMVIGRKEDGFTCLYSNMKKGKEERIDEINVISRNTYRKIEASTKNGWFHINNLYQKKTDLIPDRMERNKHVFGKSGQKAIGNIALGCIAAGGAMNPFMLNAMHAGFKKFIIADFDIIEAKNFNRLLGLSENDIGKYKVDVLKREMLKFDPTLEVKIIKSKFQDQMVQQLLLETDILVSGVDNDETRLEIQIFAARHMKPYFDMGSGIYLNDNHTSVVQKGAQVRVYIPGNACLICQGMKLENIHSETWMEARKSAGYIMNTNESPGSVITLNTTIASITLSKLIDYVTGFNPFSLLTSFDELKYNLKSHNLEKDSNCPICGSTGIVGCGEDTLTIAGGESSLPDASEVEKLNKELFSIENGDET